MLDIASCLNMDYPCDSYNFTSNAEQFFKEKINACISGILGGPQDWDNYSCFPLHIPMVDRPRQSIYSFPKNNLPVYEVFCFSAPDLKISEMTANSFQFTNSPSLVAQCVQQMFCSYASDITEFGVESDFSQQLIRLVRLYGKQFAVAMKETMKSKKAKPELIAEALVWLGDFVDPQTHEVRRDLLELGLKDENPCVRGDAITGLKLMSDKKSLPALKQAYANETIFGLKIAVEEAIKALN